MDDQLILGLGIHRELPGINANLEAGEGSVGVQELEQNPTRRFRTCGHYGNAHRPSFSNLSLGLNIYNDNNPSEYCLSP
jgi:hypothetical protein